MQWKYLHIKFERNEFDPTNENFILDRDQYSDFPLQHDEGFDFYLQDLGKKGWELVNAFTIAKHGTFSMERHDGRVWRGVTSEIHYIFKRPRLAEDDDEDTE